jgi:hypothetical protein
MRTIDDLDVFLKKLVLQRFSAKKDIEQRTSFFLGFQVKLEDGTSDGGDYTLLANLVAKNRDCDSCEIYIDLFYIKDLNDKLVITRYDLELQHNCWGRDYDIKGVLA